MVKHIYNWKNTLAQNALCLYVVSKAKSSFKYEEQNLCITEYYKQY